MTKSGLGYFEPWRALQRCPLYPDEPTSSGIVGMSRTCHEQSSKTGGQALMKSHLNQRRSGFSSAVYLE